MKNANEKLADELAVGPLAYLVQLLSARWQGLHSGESFAEATKEGGLTPEDIRLISTGEDRNPSMKVVSKLAVLFAEDSSEGAELITAMREMRIKD